MRKYRVYYYKEINDECVDCEMDIEAYYISEAEIKFNKLVRVFKRVYKIEEI